MRIRLLVLLLAVFFTSVAALAQDEPTHFRKRHTLFIEAKAGQEITLVITAIRASLGYADALAYRIYGPTGKSAAQGRLEPGETETLSFTPDVDGLYVFDGNPGMNAFSVDVQGAAWAVNINETRQVNVIDRARPLYFYVPEDLRKFTLTFNGEAAKLKLSRPDGSQAAAQDLPLYETVVVTTPVEQGQNGWWRLELELSEDQGIKFPEEIPPYIAEAPLSDELMRALTEGIAVVDFDLRPTPRQQLTAPPGQVSEELATEDGLALGFTDDGRLASVKVDGTELSGGEEAPLLGFFVRDAAKDSDLVTFRGKRAEARDALKFAYTAEGADLALDATFNSAADHINTDVSIRNLTEGDRAVTVYFALPFPAGDAVWWDDIINTRPATNNATYGAFHRASAGANGHHSVYPFGCIAGEQALALAIPMDYPLYHRIAASSASRQLFLAVDLGLTQATTKFPNRADFSFVIYRCDPRWGLRSAAERYYRIFPQFFERRMPEDGGWVCWGNCEGMTNLAELGFKYHWGPGGPGAVAFDDANGLYSFLYNDSARYFADIGEFDHRPTREEAVAGMRRLLDAADPRAQILSVRDQATGRGRYEGREKSMGREAAEQWLKDSIAAVKVSAALDGNGEIEVGYLTNRKDWGGEDWWTGRCFCNIDPDIPGGYGQFLFDRILDPTVAEYREAGAELDGFGLDNYFSNCRAVDFSRDHLAACDYPPPFATGDFRPVVVGDTIVYEWAAELKRRLEAEGKWLMANTGHQPFPFAQHLLDMNGLEWGLERTGPPTRTLAYHKQVVTLPVKPEHYEEPFIKAHLPMAAFPGGYASKTRFAPGTPVAALYAKYVPIIKRMNTAGWEPVPWATSDVPEVSIERFGTKLPMLFSLHNRGEEACAAGITVELDALGVASARSARDVVTGQDLAAKLVGGKLSFAVQLPAADSTVVEVR